MQRDIKEIVSRPEVQNEIRRMQQEMQGLRQQMERQRNK
jgi:hypothetical protein